MIINLAKLNRTARDEEKVLEKEWSLAIRERDGHNCVICGSQFHPNAHHIVPREIKKYKFDLDNGITLCTKHHKFSRKISAHNNPMAFFLWLQKYRYSQFCLAVERNQEIAAEECDL